MMRMKECKGWAHAPEQEIKAAVMRVFRQEGGYPQTVRHYFYALLGEYLIVHGALEVGGDDDGEDGDGNLAGGGQRAYGWLKNCLSDWRKDGVLPYKIIHDTGRKRDDPWYYDGIDGFLGVATQLAMRANAWVAQGRKLIITVEKEGLKAAVHRVADHYRVPVLATKGFPSVSSLKNDIADFMGSGRGYTILHIGDHDPSGLCIDTSMRETLASDMGCYPQIVRVSLTLDQALDLPENRRLSIKGTDARSEGYRARHGEYGWEVDALPTATFRQAITDAIEARIDIDVLNAIKRGEEIIEEEHEQRMSRYGAKFKREVTRRLERELGAAFTYRVFGDGRGLWFPGETVLPEPEVDDGE